MTHARRGMALITTLVVLAILLVVASSLAFTVRTETVLQAATNRRQQAAWLAEAGLQRALVELRDQPQRFTALDPTAAGENWPVVLHLLSSDEQLVQGDDQGFEVLALDENARVNLNTVDQETLVRLLPPEDQALVSPLLDWRESGEQARADGAKSDYYYGLSPPYKCRCAPFETLEELLLVKGVEASRFYAADELSPLADDAERQAINPLTTPLDRLFTVESFDQNVDQDGKARVDLRRANKPGLRQAFNGVLNDTEIDQVLKFASGAKASTPTAAPAATGPTPTPAEPPAAPGANKPSTSVAGLIDVLDRDKLRRIYDRLTVGDEAFQPGRINVNTASAEVLAALPGMDEATAQAIVTARDSTPLETVGDLLGLSEVTNERFAQVAGLLTTRGQALRLICVGTVGAGRDAVVKRVEAVVRIGLAAANGSASTDSETPAGVTPPSRTLQLVYHRAD